MGIYQLKETKNYVLHNLIEDQYEIYMCRTIENLLRVKLKSRHSNNTRHTVFNCVAEGESRFRSAVTPSVRLSVRPFVPKSCHRNSSETTDPIIMKLGM